MKVICQRIVLMGGEESKSLALVIEGRKTSFIVYKLPPYLLTSAARDLTLMECVKHVFPMLRDICIPLATSHIP